MPDKTVITQVSIVVFTLIGAVFLVFVSFFYSLTFSYTGENLSKLAMNGEPIVDALEKYKNDHGEYPEKLSQLIPEYIQSIPATGVDPLILPWEFLGQNTEVELLSEGTEYERK